MRSMTHHSYLLIIVAIIISAFNITGCRKKGEENNARSHSQYLMNHLYDDSAYVFFPNKYFPPDQVNTILKSLKTNCDIRTRTGGYKDDFYIWGTNAPDEVIFTYEYKYNCGVIRFHLGYIIQSDFYELKSFKIDMGVPSPNEQPPKGV